MNQLQDLYEYLNKASMSGMSERSANHVSAAIAIVKQMMQAKPVAGIYENRKVSIGAPDSRDVENGWSPLFTAPQAVQLFEAQPVREPCKTLCELCVKRGHSGCANTAQTTPIVVAQPVQKPLTYEQIQQLYIKAYNGGDHGRDFETAFVKEIETAHGITGIRE